MSARTPPSHLLERRISLFHHACFVRLAALCLLERETSEEGEREAIPALRDDGTISLCKRSHGRGEVFRQRPRISLWCPSLLPLPTCPLFSLGGRRWSFLELCFAGDTSFGATHFSRRVHGFFPPFKLIAYWLFHRLVTPPSHIRPSTPINEEYGQHSSLVNTGSFVL